MRSDPLACLDLDSRDDTLLSWVMELSISLNLEGLYPLALRLSLCLDIHSLNVSS